MIGIGTRYSDFTTASKTAFQNPDVRFINVNVASFDAAKQGALGLVGDARATLDELLPLLEGYAVTPSTAPSARGCTTPGRPRSTGSTASATVRCRARAS